MAWVVTAVAIAIETMEVAAVLTAIMEVGVALQVVGAVTGNKTLSKVGGVMSLVGGIGSLANAAFSGVGAAAAEGASIGVADGAAAGADAAVTAGTDAAAGGMVDAAAGAAAGMPAGQSAAEMLGGLTNSQGAGMMTAGTEAATTAASTAVAPATAAAGMPAGQSAADMMGSAISDATPAAAATFDAGAIGSVAAPADTSSFGIQKWFDGLDKATQGKVVSGAMQIGGSAVGGLFNGWSEEQKLALERQRQSLQQKAYDTSVSNANAQPRVAAYVKPTGMMGAG